MTALQVFPDLPGLSWPAVKTPMRRNRLQRTVSGREMVLQDQPLPLYTWGLPFEMLRTASDQRAGAGIGLGIGYSEADQLIGFFNQQGGSFTPFLLTDPTDCNTAYNQSGAQALGTGDGTTRAFQLQRTQGGALAGGGSTEPIYAPNSVSAVYLNGALQSSSTYAIAPASLDSGGSVESGSGMITFNSAPGSGVAITAAFTYYWPVRFADDSADFDYFMYQVYSLKQIKLRSVIP